MLRTKKESGEANCLAAVSRQAAEESKLSVYRIAKDTGVDQSTLNEFLNGQLPNPTLCECPALDGLTDCRFISLFDRLFVSSGAAVSRATSKPAALLLPVDG